MRHKRFTAALMTFILLIALFAGCGKASDSTVIAPFSEATWSYTADDIKELAGDDYTTTESVYGGDTYIVPGSYMDYDGSIKYMFDDDGALVCVAFAYTEAESEDVSALYDKINSDVTKKYGDGTHTESNYSNSGNKWIRDEGNILLLVISTEENSALQYSYLHPSVSRDADGNLSTED